jgi:hypothetical protein
METATHRMADPRVRLRVVALLAALFVLAWVAITLAGRPAGPFSGAELRDLSGVPVLPPQIEGRVGPAGPADLAGQLDDLRRRVENVQVPPELEPTPQARSRR